MPQFASEFLVEILDTDKDEIPFGHEEQWLSAVEEYFEIIRPYERIVESIREFLQPYLDGAILPETEDRHRPEVRQWLLPMIRSEFPDFPASDNEIETIALSSYLGIGARNLDAHFLKSTYGYFASGFDVRSLQNAPPKMLSVLIKTHPKIQRATETILTAREAIGAYQEALLHGLKIDFRSLGLSDKEIVLLAKNRIMNPNIPLGEVWRIELAGQILTPPRPMSLFRPFPWD